MKDEIERLIKEKQKPLEERIKDRDLFEVVDEVFDYSTVMTIIELYRRRVLKRISGVISAGKESKVYLGYDFANNPVAVKIYLTSSAEFKKGRYKYILGDPRFEGLKPKDTRALVIAWARKEYRNLTRMYEAGVKVPKPITCLNNVLVMEFVGEDRTRYPLLVEVYRELTKEELVKVYHLVIEELKKIVCKAKLVHGDLSEYNIVVKFPDESNIDIAIIDVSQAVDLNHPNALEFLTRDIRNIVQFFEKEAGISEDKAEELLGRLMLCLEKKQVGLS
ncbi:MAG: serine protein kinase RIO [Desulfurococcaceae archaeon]